MQNPYQKIYDLKKRSNRICFVIQLISIFITLLYLGLVVYLQILTNDYNTMLVYALLSIALMHLCVYIFQRNIIADGKTIKSRQLIIYWLCCLRISDPFDVEVHVNKVREKNKRLRLEMKKQQEEKEIQMIEE